MCFQPCFLASLLLIYRTATPANLHILSLVWRTVKFRMPNTQSMITKIIRKRCESPPLLLSVLSYSQFSEYALSDNIGSLYSTVAPYKAPYFSRTRISRKQMKDSLLSLYLDRLNNIIP